MSYNVKAQLTVNTPKAMYEALRKTDCITLRGLYDRIDLPCKPEQRKIFLKIDNSYIFISYGLVNPDMPGLEIHPMVNSVPNGVSFTNMKEMAQYRSMYMKNTKAEDIMVYATNGSVINPEVYPVIDAYISDINLYLVTKGRMYPRECK